MVTTTTDSRRWSALALIVTAQFMVILDVAIVNVALPSIQSDLGFSAASLQWVVSAYAILFGGALLLGGRLGDLLGRRRLLMLMSILPHGMRRATAGWSRWAEPPPRPHRASLDHRRC